MDPKMENQYDNLNNEKQNVSSTQSMDPPISNSGLQSTSSAMTPQDINPPTLGESYPQYCPHTAPGLGYPQPYEPSLGGPYYIFQPGVPNYQPPQSQQQQQQVVMSDQPKGVAPVVDVRPPPVSMVGAIVLSCIVYWCCAWLCGGIAYALAMSGQSSAAAGDTRGAIKMRNASFAVSITGIASGIIAIAVVVGIEVSALNNCYKAYYGYSFC